MAKIGNKKVKILGKEYDFKINASSTGVFYCRYDNELLKYHSAVKSVPHEYKNIDDLYATIDRFAKEINEMNTTSEMVIILDFSVNKRKFQYMPYENKVDFCFNFAIAEKITQGIAVYCVYYERQTDGTLLSTHTKMTNFKPSYETAYLCPSDMTIPYSEQNINFLLDIKSKLKDLCDKLSIFCKDEQSILSFIETNMKNSLNQLL